MIEVGEYIRTNTGLIDKVIKYITEDDTFPHDVFDYMGEFVGYSKDEITKHKKNIIDLIEVGDYVNGYRVVDIMENMKTGELHLEMTSDYTNPEIGDCTIYNKDIKTILTHEMYEQNCYKLKE